MRVQVHTCRTLFAVWHTTVKSGMATMQFCHNTSGNIWPVKCQESSSWVLKMPENHLAPAPDTTTGAYSTPHNSWWGGAGWLALVGLQASMLSPLGCTSYQLAVMFIQTCRPIRRHFPLSTREQCCDLMNFLTRPITYLAINCSAACK